MEYLGFGLIGASKGYNLGMKCQDSQEWLRNIQVLMCQMKEPNI